MRRHRPAGTISIYQRLYRLAHDRRLRRPDLDDVRPVLLPLRVKTAADLLTLLEEQITAVRADPEAGALERARALGFLTGIALKAMEAGNLQARVDMLETVLKQRTPGDKR
jgi:hypothetical protein